MSEFGTPDDADRAGVVLVPERSAVRLGGREVAATRTQFRLSRVLVAEPGRTFGPTELVEKGNGDLVSERTVDVHVKELRRKPASDGWRIETVRGRDYRYRGRPPAG